MVADLDVKACYTCFLIKTSSFTGPNFKIAVPG
jgi:hypothetical protein